MDLDLDLGDDLRLRVLVPGDAALLVEATSAEGASSLWGPRPEGPYSLHDGQAALSQWDPAAGGQFSVGVMHGQQLAGAVGLMPERPGSVEVAYWMRPEERGRGIASRAVHAATLWAHRTLAVPRLWLEIRPGNQPSLRVALRAGYHFEQLLPRHCRDWSQEVAEHDVWHDCLIWVHENDQAAAAGPDEPHGDGVHRVTLSVPAVARSSPPRPGREPGCRRRARPPVPRATRLTSAGLPAAGAGSATRSARR